MWFLWLVGCSPDPTRVDDTAGPAPTYHADVAPILERSCWGCHTEGGIAGDLPLDDARIAAQAASLVVDRVLDGSMPPFQAASSEDCRMRHAVMDDPRLTEQEIRVLQAWERGGARIGKARPHDAPRVPDLPEIDAVLTLPTAYVSGTDPTVDEFVCMVFDTPFDEPVGIAGVLVAPGDPRVVHHLQLGVDTTGRSAVLAGDRGWFPCSTNGRFPGWERIVGWTPGAGPTRFPRGAARTLEPGQPLVAKVHIHPTDVPRDVKPTIALDLFDGTSWREVRSQNVGNLERQNDHGGGLQPGPADRGEPEFRVPAGAVGHTETVLRLQETVSEPHRVFSALSHMHYLGVGMRAWVERPDGSRECILQVRDYDFDWQLDYRFDTDAGRGTLIGPDDAIRVQCTYDNAHGSPGAERHMREAGVSAPLDVYLGDRTLDEMCTLGIGLVPAE